MHVPSRRTIYSYWLALALVALAVVPTAVAVTPAREPVPAPGDVILTDLCPFPVLAHIEGGEIDTTFFDREGDIRRLLGVFPGQTLTVTNMNTLESITVSDAGSFGATLQRDGSVEVSITGHGPLPNFVTGQPGLWYLDGGHVGLTFGADGSLTAVESMGNLVDLCGELGS